MSKEEIIDKIDTLRRWKSQGIIKVTLAFRDDDVDTLLNQIELFINPKSITMPETTNKTAMNLLRDMIDAKIKDLISIAETDLECGRINGLSEVRDTIDAKMLEMEKQKMEYMYEEGERNQANNNYVSAEEFFNQTFNPK